MQLLCISWGKHSPAASSRQLFHKDDITE